MPPGRVMLAFGASRYACYIVAPDQRRSVMIEVLLREQVVEPRLVDTGVSGDPSGPDAGGSRGGSRADRALGPILLDLCGSEALRRHAPVMMRGNMAAIFDDLQRPVLPVLLIGMRAADGRPRLVARL